MKQEQQQQHTANKGTTTTTTGVFASFYPITIQSEQTIKPSSHFHMPLKQGGNATVGLSLAQALLAALKTHATRAQAQGQSVRYTNGRYLPFHSLNDAKSYIRELSVFDEIINAKIDAEWMCKYEVPLSFLFGLIHDFPLSSKPHNFSVFLYCMKKLRVRKKHILNTSFFDPQQAPTMFNKERLPLCCLIDNVLLVNKETISYEDITKHSTWTIHDVCALGIGFHHLCDKYDMNKTHKITSFMNKMNVDKQYMVQVLGMPTNALDYYK